MDLCSANINVHPAAIWTIIEVFNDQSLLSRVRAELRQIGFSAITSSQDLEKLLSIPLLQSANAEVLRLRTEVQSVFYSEREDIKINEWRFPKKSIILVPAGPAHRDPNVWNTRDGEHPVNAFWADRFLVYPNDPRSGPKRKTPAELARFQQDETIPSRAEGSQDSSMEAWAIHTCRMVWGSEHVQVDSLLKD
jgi:hypothetical protein